METFRKSYDVDLIPDDKLTSALHLEYNQLATRIAMLKAEMDAEVYHLNALKTTIERLNTAELEAKVKAQEIAKARAEAAKAKEVNKEEPKKSFFRRTLSTLTFGKL